MSERVKNLKARTRKVPLALVAGGSAVLYVKGQAHALPNFPSPWDVNEHASHIGAGAALGYAGRFIAEKIRWAENKAFALSVMASTAIGFLFETDADVLWYRNTTHDIKDAIYTAAASLIGAACVKNAVEQEAPMFTETNSLQTD